MEQVILRPVERQDLDHLLQLRWEPSAAGEFQWFGFRMDTVRELERRWQQDGLIGGAESYLAVGVDDGGCAGWVSCVRSDPLGTTRSASRCSRNTEATVSARKHNVCSSGICSRTRPRIGFKQARRSTTSPNNTPSNTRASRKKASTRGLYFRAGTWRDSVTYAVLRTDIHS